MRAGRALAAVTTCVVTAACGATDPAVRAARPAASSADSSEQQLMSPSPARRPSPSAAPAPVRQGPGEGRSPAPVEPTGAHPATTPASAPAPPEGGVMLPSYGDGPVPAALLTSARVIGSAPSGCVWLVDGEGRRHAALWPAGYSAGFHPVRVFDANGRPVWGDGHVQDVGGGFSRVGVERIPAPCRVGDVAWWVAPLDASPEPTGEPGPR